MKALPLIALLIFAVPAPVAAQDAPGTYKGHACTKDCSGHKAGYAWAEKKGITSRDQCGGKSRSFIEGCQSWVEEQEGGAQPTDDEREPDFEVDAVDP